MVVRQMRKHKFKTENLPLVLIVVVLVILLISMIVSGIQSQTSTQSVDKNYQVTGMVDNTRFNVLRAYYKDDNLVIENNINVSQDGSIQNKSIYYKLGTDMNNNVIKQGFLTKEINVPKNKINTNGNIRIQIYGVTDENELENNDVLFQIIIDRDEIVNYIDVMSDLKNYNKLSDNDKANLIRFIDLNYVNKRLISSYNNDIQSLLNPYLKANKEDKDEELKKVINLVTDKYKYYKDLAILININFDELIKNALAIEDNNYVYTAVKKSIDYIDEKMVEEVNKLEVKAIDSGVNLTEYDKQKENYPIKNQYEYLQEQLKKVTQK